MTHRFSFACCLAPVPPCSRLRLVPPRLRLYRLPLFDHDARIRLGEASPRDHGDTATGCPNAARAGGISDASLPTPGPCGARLIGSVLPTPLPRTQLIPPEGAAPRWRVVLPPEQPRPWCGLARQFPTCRTVPRHSRTAVALRFPARPQWRAGPQAIANMGACLR